MQPRGLNALDNLSSPFFVGKITAVLGGGLYSFTEAGYDGTAFVVKAGARYGDATNPAVAIAGLTLAVNDFAILRSADQTAGLKWEALARVSPSGLTVAEVDGAPSYAGTLTLSFDQTDGFVVSQPAAGTARVDLTPATPTQAGGVSIAAQTWGGQKSVTALSPQFQVQNVVTPGPSDPTAALGVAGTAATLTLQAGGFGGAGATLAYTAAGVLTLSTASGFELVADEPAHAALGFDWWFTGPGVNAGGVVTDGALGLGAGIGIFKPITYGAGNAVLLTGTGVVGPLRFIVDSGFTSAGSFARYAVRWNGTEYLGGDLDVAGSPAFRAGLYLGGTFVAAGDNNTWTGTNLFQAAVTAHPATDVVPLTVQGGGAGTADLLDAKSAGGATVFSVSAAGNVNVAGNVTVGGTISATNFSGVNTGDESPAVRAGARVYAYGRFN